MSASDVTFSPAWGSGVTLSCTNTTSNTKVGEARQQLVVTNLGTVSVYFRSGNSAVVATTADYVLPPLQQVSITHAQDHTHIAGITASGSASLHIIKGTGF